MRATKWQRHCDVAPRGAEVSPKFPGKRIEIASATASQLLTPMFQRQEDAPCLGCSVYYAAVGHGKGMWGGIGGPMKKMAYIGNFVPSAAPPLLTLFHGADSNTPLPASFDATDLEELSTCNAD